MMSSGKPRPEKAEVERRVKRRLQRLQRNRWPPSWVVPSLVTVSALHRGHNIDIACYSQPTWPTPLQENRPDAVSTPAGQRRPPAQNRTPADRPLGGRQSIP